MFETLDPRSPTPLYAQIASSIRVAVAAGELTKGQTLPSVRQLASRLRINPATVVQAYRDLEKEDFVEMRHGSGTFIRDVGESKKQSELEEQAVELVRGMLAEAGRQGVPESSIRRAITKTLGEKVA